MIKILIVDDDKTTSKHLAKYFSQQLGHQSIVENDPLNAIEVIGKEAPHVVLLDVFMPKLNGIDLLKQIKEKYGNTVKVIMVTVAGSDDEGKALKLGADDYIRKPFDRVYLRDVVMEKIQETLGYRRKEELPKENIPSMLIVDDEVDTVEEIKYFLNRVIECKVDVASDGQAAYRLLEKNEYDLVFLDIKMPKLSGIEVIKKIKKIKKLPDILVVTGYVDGDIAAQVKEEGAIGYVPKPIYLENFKKLIKEILTKKNKYFEKG